MSGDKGSSFQKLVIYLMAPVALYMLGLSIYWALTPLLVRKEYRTEVHRVAQEYIESHNISPQDSLSIRWVESSFRIEAASFDSVLKESLYTCIYGDSVLGEETFKVRVPKHRWQDGVVVSHDSIGKPTWDH